MLAVKTFFNGDFLFCSKPTAPIVATREFQSAREYANGNVNALRTYFNIVDVK